MSYTHLTRHERGVISYLKSAVSLSEIGRRLGRSHTSINRELKRKARLVPTRFMRPKPPTIERSAGSRCLGITGGRTMLPCCGT